MVDKLLLTAPEAARALGISRSKLYQLLRDGEIRSVRIGRSRRVPWDALGAYVNSLAEPEELELGVIARS